MGIQVTVTNPATPNQVETLEAGQSLQFGREQRGVGCISKQRTVSARHGLIRVTTNGFEVTAIGSQMGFVVADRTTPSRLIIARGVGPVAVPFAECSIIVGFKYGQDYLNVAVEGSNAAAQWASAWGPELRDRWAVPDPRALTQPPWPVRQWRRSNGRPYAWFGTLIELCKPALGKAPAGTPTNSQLAERLNLSLAAVERHMTEIYLAFGFEDGERDREVVVLIAIDQGIVTPADTA